MNARLSTIRVRATGASVVVLVIAFTVAGVALLDVLHASQIDGVDTALEIRANDIDSLIDEGGSLNDLAAVDAEDDFIQVVDAAGTPTISVSMCTTPIPTATRSSSGPIWRTSTRSTQQPAARC